MAGPGNHHGRHLILHVQHRALDHPVRDTPEQEVGTTSHWWNRSLCAQYGMTSQQRANALAVRLEQGALDQAAAVSLNSDAPLTCQFMLEDHAVRHSYHHLARIRAALAR